MGNLYDNLNPVLTLTTFLHFSTRGGSLHYFSVEIIANTWQKMKKKYSIFYCVNNKSICQFMRAKSFILVHTNAAAWLVKPLQGRRYQRW